MPTRILIVGGGGREHALAWKLAAEPGVNEVVVAPGSDGIAEEPRVRAVHVAGIDPGAIVDIARARSVELVVVGPEAWLAAGVADALQDAGFPVCGPTREAARIETSKAFCHDVAAAAGVRMARAIVAKTRDEADVAIREIASAGRGFVVKQDGLAAGKGVTVYGPDADPERWTDALEDLDDVADDIGGSLVIEERLEGREASVIAITDGDRVVALPPARDHKRLLDDDRGPNTGGMGAYSPLPDLDGAAVARIMDTVHRPILAELRRRGSPFRGFLYAGLMLTAEGPVLLECNARLGDPEAQVLLPLLASPLGPVLLAAARGALPVSTAARMEVLPGAAVGIVLAGRTYPDKRSAGDPIAGIEAARETALVFHSGSRLGPDGGWETDGGRVLTVVARGPDLRAARERAEAAADALTWPGVQRRRDIGATAPQAVGAAS
jgi:phosphoribosylamine--glycine ligase